LQEAEDIRRAHEHDQVVQEENFERMEADLRDKEARMRREIAKENEERIAKLVSEKMEEAMASMNLANQQTLTAGAVSGNAEQQCICLLPVPHMILTASPNHHWHLPSTWEHHIQHLSRQGNHSN